MPRILACLTTCLVTTAAVAALPPADTRPATSPVDDATPAPSPAEPQTALPPVTRIGGDLDAEVTTSVRDEVTIFAAGPCRVTTPLPVGYPAPTPPGAIDLKVYPSVRRAEIAGGGSRDDGMNGANTGGAFWPLFMHIKDRDIAMTAPVEFDYEGVDLDSDLRIDGWSMSFLYRTPELGPTGQDGRITVYDTEPVVVVSLGLRGRPDEATLRDGLAKLRAWIDAEPGWAAEDDVRLFGYNGPSVPRRNHWYELQVPIRRVETDA